MMNDYILWILEIIFIELEVSPKFHDKITV